MNAIVISLGGVHANTLGCYGGQRVETPAWDRIAAQGFVFDQCYVECPDPVATRHNWWTGRFQYQPSADATQTKQTQQPLSAILQTRSIRSALIRDTAQLIQPASNENPGFDQVHEITRVEKDTTRTVLEAARQWLEQQSKHQPFLLFVDCHAAHPPWLEDPFVDADDPDADEACVEVADELQEADEPDEGEPQEPYIEDKEDVAYLAAICRADHHLGQFLEWLEGTPDWHQTLLLVSSDVASPPAIEPNRFELHESRTHVPLILRYPGLEPGGRASALVQPVDVMPTIFDAIGLSVAEPIDGRTLLPICRAERATVRDFARLFAPGRQRAVRTANWYLVQAHQATDPQQAPGTQLFVKPDDRWEHDNVASQYPDMIEQLERFLVS